MRACVRSSRGAPSRSYTGWPRATPPRRPPPLMVLRAAPVVIAAWLFCACVDADDRGVDVLNTNDTTTITTAEDIDECAEDCDTCAGDACTAGEQTCVDPDTTVTGDWICECIPPLNGSAVNATAVCTIDECEAACATCENNTCSNGGQACYDPLRASLADWRCGCIGIATGEGIAALATCVIDECEFVCPTCELDVCEDAGQDCDDPNTAEASLDDWLCKCRAPLVGDPRAGGPATCAPPVTPTPPAATPGPTLPPLGQWVMGEVQTDVSSLTLYRNPDLLDELSGVVVATVVQWPEAVLNSTSPPPENYSVIISASSAGSGKIAFGEPRERVLQCCTPGQAVNFTVYGAVESVEYMLLTFAPHSEGGAVTEFPSPTALWKEVGDVIVMTVGPTTLALEGYEAFKGEYPHVYSEPIEALLSRTPEESVNLTAYVEGGAGVYVERKLLDDEGNVVDPNEVNLTMSDNATETTGYSWSVTEYPNIEIDVNPLRFDGKGAPSGGTNKAVFRVLCRTPGVYWIRFALAGDNLLKYAGLDGWNHTCHAPIDLSVEYTDSLPPYAGSQTKPFQVSLAARHRDYRDFGLEVRCSATDEDGAAVDTVAFYPAVLLINGEEGGQFRAEFAEPGVYDVHCTNGGNPDFNEPAPVKIRALPQIDVVLPEINIVRVLSPDGGFSGELVVDITTAPRVGLTVTPVDDSGTVLSVPEAIEFAPGVTQRTYRLQAAEAYRNGQLEEGEGSVVYEFTGPDAAHYKLPGGDGATEVIVEGPNTECTFAENSTACADAWDDMCWWDGRACRNDLIPMGFPSAVNGTFRDQYHLTTGTQSAVLAAAPAEWVGLRFGGEGMEYPVPDVRWTAGDRSAKTFAVRSSAERKEDTLREVAYEVFGADLHHYARPEPTRITILALLKLFSPTTPDLPLMYINSRSRLIEVSLELPPPGRLTLTPQLYDASGAASTALVFEPEVLVFDAAATVATFRMVSTGALGTYRIEWAAGGDAQYYRTPQGASVKVFPSNSITSLHPLATLAPFEWSPTQWLQMERLPEEPTAVRVSCSSATVLFRHPPGTGQPAGDFPGGIDVAFNPTLRTVGFQVMGPYTGGYTVTVTPVGEEASNFAKPAPQPLRIQENAVWYSVANQFGVDPVCRVSVGRTLYHYTGLADATDETCQISDVLDEDGVCELKTSEEDCAFELHAHGYPCVWYSENATCVYGLPNGNVTHWSVSATHSVFRMLDGSVWTAGKNEFGQLGHSCYGTRGCLDSRAYREVLFEDRDFRGRCVQFEIDPVSKIEVCKQFSARDLTDGGFMDFVVAVAAGASHSMALTAGGRLYAWGSNYHGQLGIEDTSIQMATIPTRLATPQRPLVESITCISAGAYHSVMVVDTGRVYTWGWNSHGQLGDNSTYRGGVRMPVPITDAIDFWTEDLPVSVAAGQYHTVLATESGKVYTWGRNNYGQLGRVGFDELVPSLVDDTAAPKTFRGGLCDPDDMVNWDSWPDGTDFTLGRQEPSIYERAADNTG